MDAKPRMALFSNDGGDFGVEAEASNHQLVVLSCLSNCLLDLKRRHWAALRSKSDRDAAGLTCAFPGAFCVQD